MCIRDRIEAAITANTKAIFIETPSNPLMEECDVAEIAKLAKKHSLLMIVDNTFLTPVLSRPLDLGADIVIHSGTKYIAGHNDSLVGLIIAKGQELCDRIAYIQNGAGAVLSPFDSWLTAVSYTQLVPLGTIGRFPNPTELGENPAYDSLKDSRGIQAPYLYYGDIIGEDVKKRIDAQAKAISSNNYGELLKIKNGKINGRPVITGRQVRWV